MMLWLLLACAPPTATLTLADDPATVVTATWDDPSESWPEATLCTEHGDCLTREGMLEDGVRTAVFVFAPPETEVAVRVGERPETTTLQTGSAPDWLDASPSVSGEPLPRPFWVTSVNGADEAGPVVLDDEGRPVWWHPAGDHYVARARLGPDGDTVQFLSFELLLGNEDYEEATAELVTVSLTGEELDRTSLPGAHHDFVVQGGELHYLRFAVQERLGDTWVGDELVRLDADGGETVLFSSWDDFSFEEDGGGAQAYWSLANHLDLHGDGFVLGFRSLDTFATLDDDGTLLEAWGNATGATAVPNGFTQQHGMSPTADGWVVFDNGFDDGARLVAFDEDGVITSTVSPDPAVFTPVLGDVVVTDDTWVSSWGLGRALRQVSPEGELLTELQYDLPVLALGFLEPLDVPPGAD